MFVCMTPERCVFEQGDREGDTFTATLMLLACRVHLFFFFFFFCVHKVAQQLRSTHSIMIHDRFLPFYSLSCQNALSVICRFLSSHHSPCLSNVRPSLSALHACKEEIHPANNIRFPPVVAAAVIDCREKIESHVCLSSFRVHHENFLLLMQQ